MPVRKVALPLLASAIVAWATAYGVAPSGPTGAATPAAEVGGTQCAIGGFPQGEVPPLGAAPLAELLPEQTANLERAYFSMGCFWGSEAMLGSCPGVLFTRVGFTGGSLPDPSYAAIGDHVETVEVLYDPGQVSYERLLEHFFDHHNAHAKPIFRQYASAVFATNRAQEQAARALRQRREAGWGQPILTAVRPLDRFYPAEPSHQKYYLSQDPDLLERLPRYGAQKLETRLATKLNALSAKAGDRTALLEEMRGLGLSEAVCEALFARVSWAKS